MFASEPVSRLSTQMTRCPREQVVAEVGAEEAGAAGDETGGHAQPSLAAGMTGTRGVEIGAQLGRQGGRPGELLAG